MAIVLIIIGIVLSYLLGAFPTSVILGKARMGIDIREHGSGNAGATNTFRVLGKKSGMLVMGVDIFKGYTATMLPYFLFLFDFSINDNQFAVLQLVFGMAAVLGHIFPVYARFKGGKGVASLLGMVIAFNSGVALVCMAIFLIILIATKYVSLGSMLASLAFPILLTMPKINPHDPTAIQIGFGVFIFIMVVYTHRKNVSRLLNGEENKTYLFKKKSQQEA